MEKRTVSTALPLFVLMSFALFFTNPKNPQQKSLIFTLLHSIKSDDSSSANTPLYYYKSRGFFGFSKYTTHQIKRVPKWDMH